MSLTASGSDEDRDLYYENVFSVLQKNDIRYAVAGGVALVLHGVVRFTAYLDLIVDLERENLERFIETMHALGYRPRNPVNVEGLLDPATRAGWQREKGMEMFSFVDPAQPMTLIYVFIQEKIPFPEIMQELVPMTAKGITIPVVSLSHLRTLKKSAGRPQDLADIEAIEEMEKSEKEQR